MKNVRTPVSDQIEDEFIEELEILHRFVAAHPGLTWRGLLKKLKDLPDEERYAREFGPPPMPGWNQSRKYPSTSHFEWKLRYLTLRGDLERCDNRWYACTPPSQI